MVIDMKMISLLFLDLVFEKILERLPPFFTTCYLGS